MKRVTSSGALLGAVVLIAAGGCSHGSGRRAAAQPHADAVNDSGPGYLAARSRDVEVTYSDARWSQFGDYINRLQEAVQLTWDNLTSRLAERPPAGSSVEIRFVLSSTGDLKSLTLVRSSPSMTAKGGAACEAALRHPAPFAQWTDQMVSALGKEQPLTVRFVYP